MEVAKWTKKRAKILRFGSFFVRFIRNFGLSDWTWTSGLYHPKVARYQLRHTQIHIILRQDRHLHSTVVIEDRTNSQRLNIISRIRYKVKRYRRFFWFFRFFFQKALSGILLGLDSWLSWAKQLTRAVFAPRRLSVNMCASLAQPDRVFGYEPKGRCASPLRRASKKATHSGCFWGLYNKSRGHADRQRKNKRK